VNDCALPSFSNLSGLMTGLWKWPDSRQSFHWELLQSSTPAKDWDIRFLMTMSILRQMVIGSGVTWLFSLPCWFRSLTSTPDSKSCAIGQEGSGGPYPTSLPQDALASGAHYLVLDEGDNCPQFLEALAEGK